MAAEGANESELTLHTALDVTSARPLVTKPIGVHEIVNAKSAHLHTSQRRLFFRAAVTWVFCSRTGT
jgi:hypothetical protein